MILIDGRQEVRLELLLGLEVGRDRVLSIKERAGVDHEDRTLAAGLFYELCRTRDVAEGIGCTAAGADLTPNFRQGEHRQSGLRGRRRGSRSATSSTFYL